MLFHIMLSHISCHTISSILLRSTMLYHIIPSYHVPDMIWYEYHIIPCYIMCYIMPCHIIYRTPSYHTKLSHGILYMIPYPTLGYITSHTIYTISYIITCFAVSNTYILRYHMILFIMSYHHSMSHHMYHTTSYLIIAYHIIALHRTLYINHVSYYPI